jgi:hypothetical protein
MVSPDVKRLPIEVGAEMFHRLYYRKALSVRRTVVLLMFIESLTPIGNSILFVPIKL